MYWCRKLLVSIDLNSSFSRKNSWRENKYKNKANSYQVWHLLIIYLSFVSNVSMWISATSSACVTLPFTYLHVLSLLTSDLLLCMIGSLPGSVVQLFLTYSHVPDEGRMINHQNSYLMSIHLTFVLSRRFNKGQIPLLFFLLYTSIAFVT